MAKLVSSRKFVFGALAALQLAFSSSLMLSSAAIAADESKKSHPHIDLAFCIDTTGSMQSEIDNVKAKTKEIVAKLAGGKPAPVIRVGLVAYRDRGDEYVTKVFPFTEDIDTIVKQISDLKAQGGGDTPEAVNQALHASVNDLKWDDSKGTLKLLFLIGDAGPNHYPGDFDWHNEAKSAISKGIQINTVGCKGIEMLGGEGEGVFKEIAHLADGKYEPLSYRSQIMTADGKRETVVASGGSYYKLKAGAGDWHAGARALEAKGAAERVDMPVAAAAPMAMSSEGFLGATAKTARMSLRAAGGAGGGAPARSFGYAAPAASLDSRSDNNLADLVLNATKDAAKKKLNVDFTEK